MNEMIEFRTLGTPDLRDDSDRHAILSVLAQPKRVGLLAYLLICRAVLAKQIGDREAQAAIRAVEAWLKAEGDRLTVHVVEELKVEVTRLKAELRGKDKLRAM